MAEVKLGAIHWPFYDNERTEHKIDLANALSLLRDGWMPYGTIEGDKLTAAEVKQVKQWRAEKIAELKARETVADNDTVAALEEVWKTDPVYRANQGFCRAQYLLFGSDGDKDAWVSVAGIVRMIDPPKTIKDEGDANFLTVAPREYTVSFVEVSYKDELDRISRRMKENTHKKGREYTWPDMVRGAVDVLKAGGNESALRHIYKAGTGQKLFAFVALCNGAGIDPVHAVSCKQTDDSYIAVRALEKESLRKELASARKNPTVPNFKRALTRAINKIEKPVKVFGRKEWESVRDGNVAGSFAHTLASAVLSYDEAWIASLGNAEVTAALQGVVDMGADSGADSGADDAKPAPKTPARKTVAKPAAKSTAAAKRKRSK